MCVLTSFVQLVQGRRVDLGFELLYFCGGTPSLPELVYFPSFLKLLCLLFEDFVGLSGMGTAYCTVTLGLGGQVLHTVPPLRVQGDGYLEPCSHFGFRGTGT